MSLTPIDSLYHHASQVYLADIAPFADPLALDFAATITGHYRRALDVGTGNGALGLRLRTIADQIIGLDSVPAMLALIPKNTLSTVVAGATQPPFAAATFDLIAASFGLAACPPKTLLKTLYRLLTPGGLLMFQEWGPIDPYSAIVQALLTDAAPDSIQDELAALSAPYQAWGAAMQDADDYHTLLTAIGFTAVMASEQPVAPIAATRGAFLHYRLAWLPAARVLETHPAPARLITAMMDALPERFDWAPTVFRISARKPSG